MPSRGCSGSTWCFATASPTAGPSGTIPPSTLLDRADRRFPAHLELCPETPSPPGTGPATGENPSPSRGPDLVPPPDAGDALGVRRAREWEAGHRREDDDPETPEPGRPPRRRATAPTAAGPARRRRRHVRGRAVHCCSRPHSTATASTPQVCTAAPQRSSAQPGSCPRAVHCCAPAQQCTARTRRGCGLLSPPHGQRTAGPETCAATPTGSHYAAPLGGGHSLCMNATDPLPRPAGAAEGAVPQRPRVRRSPPWRPGPTGAARGSRRASTRWSGRTRAGLHEATGGDGDDACSADMLLEAVLACAGVTMRAVATSMGLVITARRPLRRGRVRRARHAGRRPRRAGRHQRPDDHRDRHDPGHRRRARPARHGHRALLRRGPEPRPPAEHPRPPPFARVRPLGRSDAGPEHPAAPRTLEGVSETPSDTTTATVTRPRRGPVRAAAHPPREARAPAGSRHPGIPRLGRPDPRPGRGARAVGPPRDRAGDRRRRLRRRPGRLRPQHRQARLRHPPGG